MKFYDELKKAHKKYKDHEKVEAAEVWWKALPKKHKKKFIFFGVVGLIVLFNLVF